MSTRTVFLCSAAVVASVLALATPAAASAFTFSIIDYPSSSATDIYGINNAGSYVGDYSNGTNWNGFENIGGIFTTINFPSSTDTRIYGISNTGELVGQYQSGGVWHGFYEIGGTFTTVDPIGSTNTVLYGINSSGLMVGQATNGSSFGFTFDGTSFTTLLGPSSSCTTPTGINDSGTIAGNYCGGSGFLDTAGVFSTFNIASGSTDPWGISNSGDITGTYFDGLFHGFVDVGGSATSLDYVTNGGCTSPHGINSADVVVGSETCGGGTHGFIDTNNVPEPLTLSVFGAALAGTVAMRRRKKLTD